MTVAKVESNLIKTNLINKEIKNLDDLPENARVILVVGGAGSGKTAFIHTFLNLFEKQLSIEEATRFQLTGTQKKGVLKMQDLLVRQIKFKLM